MKDEEKIKEKIRRIIKRAHKDSKESKTWSKYIKILETADNIKKIKNIKKNIKKELRREWPKLMEHNYSVYYDALHAIKDLIRVVEKGYLPIEYDDPKNVVKIKKIINLLKKKKPGHIGIFTGIFIDDIFKFAKQSKLRLSKKEINEALEILLREGIIYKPHRQLIKRI